MIQFEDFLFRKVKIKTTLDRVIMSILNFDWLVLHEIMTREVQRDRSSLQTKQQQKSDDPSGILRTKNFKNQNVSTKNIFTKNP